MSLLTKYNLRMSHSGGSIRQDLIDSTKAFYTSAWKDDPTYYVVPLNGIDTEMRIYDKNTQTVGYGHKYIQLLDLTLPPIGGYIFWNDRYWLITNSDEGNEIEVTGTIRECNHNIKWLNNDGEIIERWGIFHDSTRYSSGEQTYNTLITGSTRYELYMPKDSETVKLPRDKRFIIDDYDHAQHVEPSVFIITKTNFVEKRKLDDGIFIFIMAEDEYNPAKDSREHMIADYYLLNNVYSLKVSTPASVEIELGGTLQIHSEIKKNNFDVNETIYYTSDDENVATVTHDGIIKGIGIGNTHIKVIFHSNVETISVNVVNLKLQLQNSCTISYSGEATIRLGSMLEKTFNAKFYDGSGNEMSDIAQWEIYDAQKSNPAYVDITKQTLNSISIRVSGNIDLVGRIFYLKLTGTSQFATDTVAIEILSLT